VLIRVVIGRPGRRFSAAGPRRGAAGRAPSAFDSDDYELDEEEGYDSDDYELPPSWPPAPAAPRRAAPSTSAEQPPDSSAGSSAGSSSSSSSSGSGISGSGTSGSGTSAGARHPGVHAKAALSSSFGLFLLFGAAVGRFVSRVRAAALGAAAAALALGGGAARLGRRKAAAAQLRAEASLRGTRAGRAVERLQRSVADVQRDLPEVRTRCLGWAAARTPSACTPPCTCARASRPSPPPLPPPSPSFFLRPPARAQDTWGKMLWLWDRPPVQRLRLTISMANLSFRLPALMALVATQVGLLASQVSLPMLAPLLLGTGMLLRSIRANASFLLPRIGLVVVMLWLLWFANSVVQNTTAYLRKQGAIDARLAGGIITVSECSALLVAMVVILSMLGVNVSALLLPAGVALAVAAKDLTHNFLAGFFLFVVQPFKLGDRVAVASSAPGGPGGGGGPWFEGVAEKVDLRYTSIRQGRRRLMVPNSAFLTREFMVLEDVAPGGEGPPGAAGSGDPAHAQYQQQYTNDHRLVWTQQYVNGPPVHQELAAGAAAAPVGGGAAGAGGEAAAGGGGPMPPPGQQQQQPAVQGGAMPFTPPPQQQQTQQQTPVPSGYYYDGTAPYYPPTLTSPPPPTAYWHPPQQPLYRGPVGGPVLHPLDSTDAGDSCAQA
jgi:hypothetical protein